MYSRTPLGRLRPSCSYCKPSRETSACADSCQTRIANPDLNEQAQDRSLFWHYPHYHKTKPYGAIRSGDWKLIEFFEDGKLELYNLKKDLGEQKNLAETYPEKAAALLKEMQQWRHDVGAQEMTLNPEYNPDVQGKAKEKTR